MARRTITAISVEHVEKRRLPSKHYVYVIVVQWSDEVKSIVYRRYSKFYDLQCHLLFTFPHEAGHNEPVSRILPFLPGKILFGRSHIRDVAMKRLNPLHHYCKRLICLPARISECKAVLDFFDTWPEDINALRRKSVSDSENGDRSDISSIHEISEPVTFEQYLVIADYKKEASNEVTVFEGQLVQVVEKNSSGWWFVHVDDSQGWVPSPYLERMDGAEEDRVILSLQDGHGERYLCHIAFQATHEDEISIERGALVEVTEKNLDGWWMVRYQDHMGRAPATNLIRVDMLSMDRIVNRSNLEPPEPKPQPVVPKGAVPTPFTAKDLRDTHVKPKYHPTVSSGVKKPAPDPVPDVYDDGSVYENIFVNPSPQNDQLKASMSKFLDNAPIYSKEYVIPPRKGSIAKDEPPDSTTPPPRPETPDLSRTDSQSTPGRHGHKVAKTPKVKVKYLTTKDFTKGSSSSDSLTFKAGQEVEVLEKTENGWWLVKIDDQEGWVPVSYLEIKKTVKMPSITTKVPPPKPPPPAAHRVCHLVTAAQQMDQSGYLKPPVRPPKQLGAMPEATTSTNATGKPSKPEPIQPKPRTNIAVKATEGQPWQSEVALNQPRQADLYLPLPTVRKSSLIEDLQRNLGLKRHPAPSKKAFTPAVGPLKEQPPPPLQESLYSIIPELDYAGKPLGVAQRLDEGEEEEIEWDAGIYDDVEHAEDLVDLYIAKKKFKALETGEMSMHKGTRVRLLEKSNTGWWLVKDILKKTEGWVPEVLLRVALETTDTKPRSEPSGMPPVNLPKQVKAPQSSPHNENQHPKPQSPIGKIDISRFENKDQAQVKPAKPKPVERGHRVLTKPPAELPLTPPAEPPRHKPSPRAREKPNRMLIAPGDDLKCNAQPASRVEKADDDRSMKNGVGPSPPPPDDDMKPKERMTPEFRRKALSNTSYERDKKTHIVVPKHKRPIASNRTPAEHTVAIDKPQMTPVSEGLAPPRPPKRPPKT